MNPPERLLERYSIDPSLISMKEFYDLTMSKRLVPGRVLLRENMREQFQLLHQAGISNLKQLLSALNSRDRIRKFTSTSGIPEGYLLLLKREAGSYLSSPFSISYFPGIPYEYVEVLKSENIKNTKAFFELVQTADQQKELEERTGIPEARLKEIFTLCDLSRITGIGGTFARIVYEAGIRSVEEFARTDTATHTGKYNSIIEKHGYTSARIADEDIQYCIDYATVIHKCRNITDHS